MVKILIPIEILTGICPRVEENILLNTGLDQYVPSVAALGTQSRLREQAPVEHPVDTARPQAALTFSLRLLVQEHHVPDHLHCKYNKFQVLKKKFIKFFKIIFLLY